MIVAVVVYILSKSTLVSRSCDMNMGHVTYHPDPDTGSQCLSLFIYFHVDESHAIVHCHLMGWIPHRTQGLVMTIIPTIQLNWIIEQLCKENVFCRRLLLLPTNNLYAKLIVLGGVAIQNGYSIIQFLSIHHSLWCGNQERKFRNLVRILS